MDTLLYQTQRQEEDRKRLDLLCVTLLDRSLRFPQVSLKIEWSRQRFPHTSHLTWSQMLPYACVH